MTRIFIADVSCIDIEAFLGKVSPARREKTLRLAGDDDKRRSLGVELLLKKVTGRSDYVLSENEKPFFSDNEVFFSLAHCGDYAVCAVSDVPVGVDIELPRVGGARLAKRFFQPDEAALVYAADDPDREFCRLWALKESYIKYADLRLGNVRSFSVVSGAEGCSFSSASYGEYLIGCCAKTQDIGEVIVINEKI